MRIGLVLDESFDNPDGVQQYMRQVGQWLTVQGHEVHYLVGQTKRSDIKNIHSMSRNVRVKFNGNWLSIPLPVSRKKLAATLDELKLDVLHIQTPYSPFMAGRLMQLAGDSTAVVGTFHILPYSWLANVGSVALRLLNARSARRFDAMMAVSEPAREFAHLRYGFDCQVVPNTFDDHLFAAAKAAGGTHKNIVFLGRLVKRKGALYLLQAISHLRREHRFPADWRVIIGGKGGLVNDIEQYIDAHELADIVTLSGFISEADKPNFLAQADIAVFPSTGGESFGISLLEAMAASRGVVLAGDNPGYRSVMTGLEEQLIHPSDAAAFADTLAYWMQQQDRRDVQATAQRTYVKRFDESVVGPAIEAVYTNALQIRRAS